MTADTHCERVAGTRLLQLIPQYDNSIVSAPPTHAIAQFFNTTFSVTIQRIKRRAFILLGGATLSIQRLDAGFFFLKGSSPLSPGCPQATPESPPGPEQGQCPRVVAVNPIRFLLLARSIRRILLTTSSDWSSILCHITENHPARSSAVPCLVHRGIDRRILSHRRARVLINPS